MRPHKDVAIINETAEKKGLGALTGPTGGKRSLGSLAKKNNSREG